ncbi:MAG: sirohydrochlorin cobaltochelatase [Desulfamplus sp.]|nr:sirohydrochlorin cobaltochelatase [Desulfamplus sp.]
MECNIVKKSVIFIMAITFIFIAFSVASAAHGKKQETKKGILLVAFGSSEESAQISFDNIDKKTKAAFPDVPVYWAYTSHIIRNKLAKQGKILDAPEVALAKMRAAEFTHVAVQSLHTILGEEYHDLRKMVGAFNQMGGFEKIILGYPLMATQDDMVKVVDAILKNIPKERKSNEAVVLMGHGTQHPANAFYAALMFQIQLKDPNIFVGTVEGYPEVDDIKELMVKQGVKKAYLMPFMSVAGDHAKNDMAGDEDDSWKSVLTKAGIECRPILKGTAEFDDFVNIWIDHLKAVMAHF